MQTVLSILGTALTLASLVYAIKTGREKVRLERLVKAKLAGLAGNINAIRPSAAWADRHLININRHALNLERGPDMSAILDSAQLGARDATAATRMLDNLLNEVLSLQDGLFGERLVTHPGAIEDVLTAAARTGDAVVGCHAGPESGDTRNGA
jgi:hypothetical protein